MSRFFVGRLAQHALVSVAALLSCGYVYNACITETSFFKTSDRASPLLAPVSQKVNARILIEENKVILQSKSDSKSVKLRDNIQDILRRAPINETALLHHALSDTDANNTIRDITALQSAKTRRARNVTVRQKILQYNLSRENFTEALAEIDLLLRLDSKNRDLYISYLSAIYTQKSGRDLINARMNKAPLWANSFLAHQIQNAHPSTLSSLEPIIQKYILANPKQRSSLNRYVARLIKLNLYDTAYSAWLNDAGPENISTGPRANWIFNHEFNDIDALQPFNWKFFNSKFNRTEYMMGGGTYSTFKRTNTTLIMSQIVKNRKNALRLTLSHMSDFRSKSQNGDFEWRIICMDAPTIRLATSKVIPRELAKPPKLQSVTFDAPTCDYIRVSLYGIPGIFTQRVSFITNSISLTAAETR